MSVDKKKPPVGGSVDQVLAGLIRQAPQPPYEESVAALVEWTNGEHTHLALEVMAVDGSWEPLAAVALADCLCPAVRSQLRQFPLFRLAWYGQLGEPGNIPQRLAPEQANVVSSDAMT